MYAFSINMAIAVMWLLLSKEPSVASFSLGFITGYAMLFAFRSILPGGAAYIRRSVAFARFCGSFARQFVMANAVVAVTVLTKSRDELSPDFLTYDVSDLRPGEILLLSYCITLTPGTVTIKVAEDGKSMVLHALDAADPAQIRESIDKDLKQAILAFTR